MTDSREISLPRIIEMVASARRFFFDEKMKNDVHIKGPIDFVTAVDLHVQAYLQETLRREYPNIQFMGEEKDNDEIDFSGRVWILDPVDGTANLVHDLHASAISLGLYENGTGVLGVICNPYTDEMFSAVRGGGAFLNGKPIHVTDAPDLAHSMVIVGTSSNHRQRTAWTFDCFREIFEHSEDIRHGGSAALSLADVARGRYGALFQRYLMPWDYAAGKVIIEEAGGFTADLCGDPLSCRSSRPSAVLAAANETIMQEMLTIINPDQKPSEVFIREEDCL